MPGLYTCSREVKHREFPELSLRGRTHCLQCLTAHTPASTLGPLVWLSVLINPMKSRRQTSERIPWRQIRKSLCSLLALIPWSIRCYIKLPFCSLSFLFPWLLLILPEQNCFPPGFLRNLFISCTLHLMPLNLFTCPSSLLILHTRNLGDLIWSQSPTWKHVWFTYVATFLLSRRLLIMYL